ncbi:hypothetical protein [Kitasatospora sp. KL5]|uniref:hypothetical protein n=1 Tax=Kitasatospora sp. KL5 TaxID=3425125 RepID=UPI003D6E1FD3
MDAEDRAYLQGLRAAAAALTPAERQRWEHAALLANVVCWGDDLASETSRELWDAMLTSLRVLSRPRSTPD